MSSPASSAASGLEIGWDDPATAELYERFCERHDRYTVANAALLAGAELADGQRILDLAAGTGRTTAAILDRIAKPERIVCVEPAEAMAAVGRGRLRHASVHWTDQIPRAKSFDRIVCGAAIWQLTPLRATIAELSARLAAGGTLCFNVPGLYLGLADEPGGGSDPLLLQLPALLSSPPSGPCKAAEAPSASQPLSVEVIDALLREQGLAAKRWFLRHRLTQGALRDWLKVPVLTNRLLAGLDAEERARRIDEAYCRSDPASWRWERWICWSAAWRTSSAISP